MKAQSDILVQVQRQMTFLGLPMRLLALAAIGGVIGMLPGIALDILPLLLIGFSLGFVIAWVWLFRKVRSDLHFDRDITQAPSFWIGQGQHRQLIAGGAP
ncbi:MAG: hypothetical protein OQK35_03195 [Alphaproteobacteria bacterium]|nr:hypothetical protein [Rhodospirillales bacterium]MCW9045317.1 hypothetical protein [Alphaproteobacteria bacterium]